MVLFLLLCSCICPPVKIRINALPKYSMNNYTCMFVSISYTGGQLAVPITECCCGAVVIGIDSFEIEKYAVSVWESSMLKLSTG